MSSIALGARPRSVSLEAVDAYWRAANYISVGQIYLMDNPLLRRPLEAQDVKRRLLGHWGTSPGLNLIYAHMNRAIIERGLNAFFIAGPGHGGPAVVAQAYLEGTYSELYAGVSRDEDGLRRLFKQFSFPGGIPSHASPQTPGSLHEGGELGYSLAHAYGAVFDRPDLLACCVIGDGEAETGALATSWHSNKFLNPRRDGAVLPVLHLNGYKIAGPTVLARIPSGELHSLLRGYGYQPIVVEGENPELVHGALASALDRALDAIDVIQTGARRGRSSTRPVWPMIVLKTPKGWTGPKVVDGVAIEGTFRAHQLPLSDPRNDSNQLRMLETWMRSYRPGELFDADGAPAAALNEVVPSGAQRMSANPVTNGGGSCIDLRMPDFRQYAVAVAEPGCVQAESTRVLGGFLRDIVSENPESMRVFGPDETSSNRLDAIFEVTSRMLDATVFASDDHVSHDGRVLEVLSEHLCQGWLEGYLLTGRHGIFSCYEAFVHIVDSMFNQHAKWLKSIREIAWRLPLPSLNYLITSHVWRQDHNGFSHQDPGFIDHVVNKKAEVVRVYLPPDANTLLSVANHCLRSRNYVNVIVAGKQPEWQWLDMEAAAAHCSFGAGIWEWASSDEHGDPDVVMAAAGDVPTLETLAAVDFLRRHVPLLRVRVVNVVDLMILQSPGAHPHGLSDADFDSLFTTSKPVIFAFHGYPALIHRLTYKRTNHAQFHVHGYLEEGTTTTPFDMTVRNRLDRFHLAAAAIEAAGIGDGAAHVFQHIRSMLARHRSYIEENGEDMPEIREWRWSTESRKQ